MVDRTEASAQRGGAVNSTFWPEPIRVSVVKLSDLGVKGGGLDDSKKFA
jgi:hypothetical protein